MIPQLHTGQVVTAQPSGLPCEVEQLLGGGGQGEVYRASLRGSPVALKWYFPSMATAEQRAALLGLIKRGPPSARFLWPMELASDPGVPGFGYVMPLRSARYKSITDLLQRRIEPSFHALARAGMELADAYLQLHARGLCYRDISFGNAFFDPRSGDVLICDNDNVAVDGSVEGGVLGTPRFMAPEVVRREAFPSTETDVYSLAVLLFYMFTLHHPLEGARESAVRTLGRAAMARLYGAEPVFIFDPDDDSNRPDPRYHEVVLNFWRIYPRFLRDLFTRAFTEGIRDPRHGRVREGQWRAALSRLRDLIVYCPSCSAEVFYDPDVAGAERASEPACWSCGRPAPLPPRIQIGRHLVMLNHDTRLYPHHLDEARLYDFAQPAAEIVAHPSLPGVWGLRNLTTSRWVCARPGGEPQPVEPGRSVTLTAGLRIHFGQGQGEITGEEPR